MDVAKSASDSVMTVKKSSHNKAMSDNKIKESESQPDGHGNINMQTTDSKKDVIQVGQGRRNSPDLASGGDHSLRSERTGVRHRKHLKEDLKSDVKHPDKIKDLPETKSKMYGSTDEQLDKEHQEKFDDLGKNIKSGTENVSSSIADTEVESSTLKDSRAYYLCWMILTLLSLFTRLHNIEVPAHVCWDETHFGKMGSWYINRTFFFDVHPPLGKMLIGLAGLTTGYDGSFPFEKPGDLYGDTEYVGMRRFCAVLGASLVPLAYQSVWLLTHSVLASLFAGAIILTDTGTLTLSRHILLDPILLFFIMLSTWCCLKALSNRHRPFSVHWWFWMTATGFSLAGAVGVKFVGLFIVLFVGYTTAADLWNLLGNLSLPMGKLFHHLAARAVCLIAVPIGVYCCFYAVHFHVLNHSGNGDGFFSSAFQSQLIGNRLHNISMPQYVAYGSEITLKQKRIGGAYLHSHAHLYPENHPPRQQQVTTYSHKDENNRWRIKPADRELTEGGQEKVEYLHSGDLVRLEHIVTRRNLHSHREMAPLTRHHFQVSGYGQDGLGDANDIWRVEVTGAAHGDRVQVVRSNLRLVHYTVGCLLYSHDKKLPKWGWDQMEVTCQPDIRDTKAAWNVEEVVDPRLENVSFSIYSPTFLEKFVESHAVMTQGNSGLKPKEGEITSQPWHWPINYRGQMFSGPNFRIYLLGNPILFWGLLGLKCAFLLFWLAFQVACKRGVAMNKQFHTHCERTVKVCWWLLLGWFLHYAPFWTMSRVLYFHHYFPAFLFSAMFGGITLDLLLTLLCVSLPGMARTLFTWGLIAVLAVLAGSLYLFHPLVYGMTGPRAAEVDSMMHGLKWMESWDI